MIFNLKKRIIFSFICILLVVSFASFVGYSGLFIDIFFDHNPRTSFEQEFSPIAKQHTQIKNEIFNQVKEKSQKIDWAFIPTIEAQNKKLKFGHVILVNNHISYRSSSLDTLPEDWYTLYQINEYDPTFDKDRPYLFDIMNNSTIYTQQDKIELISFNIFTPTEIPYFKYFALYNLMIIFLILGITTLTVYKIFKHIQNLVTQLSTMTEQITNGDIESEMSLDNENEFSRLAEHIDLLRQHLLASHKEKVEMEAERERMFSNITHDIKTPITSIKGYSQVLSSDYIEDPKTRKEYLEIIVNKSQVIETMVDNLSAVIHYKGHNLQATKIDLSIQDFLNDCLQEYTIDKQNSSYAFQVHFNKNISTINADPTLLQRVFTNIISNAIKYNRDNFITIKIECFKNKDSYVFDLSDNGIGVPNESLPKLFDRLYRVDASRNSSIEGNGIGLSICKEIVETHGGTIKAFNENGWFKIRFTIKENEVTR